MEVKEFTISLPILATIVIDKTKEEAIKDFETMDLGFDCDEEYEIIPDCMFSPYELKKGERTGVSVTGTMDFTVLAETEEEALERAIEKYRQAEHNEHIEKIEFLSRGIHLELDDVYIQAQEIDDKRSLNMEEIQIILESELKAKGLDYKKVKYCVENAKDFILNDFAERQDHFTVKKVMDDCIDKYKFRTKGQLLKNIQFYLREGLII